MKMPFQVPNYLGQTAAAMPQGQGMLRPLRSLEELQADFALADSDLDLASQLLSTEYIPNSGALGAVAMMFNAYQGKKTKKGAEAKIADLMRESSDLMTRKEREELERAAAAERRKIEAAIKAGFTPGQAEAMVVGGLKASDVKPKEKDPYQQYLESLPPEKRDQAFAVKAGLAARPGSGTSVSVNLPPQIGAFQTALGKRDAELYSTARDKATAASQALNSIDALDKILSNTQTGKPQEVLGQLAQWVGAPQGADYQATNALVNDRVFELINSLKGPATDKDAERAMAQIPNMGTDPRARAVVFDYLRKKAGTDIQFFDEMDAYATEQGGLQGFKPRVGQFSVDTRPLGGESGTGGMGEATDKPPVPGARRAPDGFWYVRHGNGYARVE
jgi:hypothetical protein